MAERTIHTPSELHGVAFSADGKLLASAGHREQVHVWDVATGELRQTLAQPGPPQIQVAFGRDDRWLASSDTDGTVWLWDRTTGKATAVSRCREKQHCPVVFHPNGRELVFPRDQQTVVRDLEAGRERVLDGQTGKVTQVGVSADGKWVAGGSADGYVRLYSLDSAAAAREPMARRLHAEKPSLVRFSADEETVALIFPGRLFGITRVRLCDPKGEVRAEWKFAAPTAEDPAVSDDLRWLANVADKTSVQLRDLKTGAVERTLAQEHDPQELVFLAFTPDGKRLAGCGEERTVLWDLETGLVERTLEDVPMRPWGLLTAGTALHFSPDGRRCAYATAEGAAVRDVAGGQTVFTCQRHLGEITTMAFSRDGTRFASVSADGVIKVWDLSSGKEEHTLVGHTAQITAIAFHPDGTRLASGAGDGSLRLWDLTTGEEALIIEEQGALFSPVLFSPSGRGLLWGTQKGAWLTTVEGR
jgi:WD40 repeat protein